MVEITLLPMEFSPVIHGIFGDNVFRENGAAQAVEEQSFSTASKGEEKGLLE